MFVNKLFAYLTCAYLTFAYHTCTKSKTCFNAKSSRYYLHMKTNILADFQICISVPLMLFLKATIFCKN